MKLVEAAPQHYKLYYTIYYIIASLLISYSSSWSCQLTLPLGLYPHVFRWFLSQFSTDYREIFIKKYYVVQKLDHLTWSKFEITTSLYKPIKLVKLKFVFSPELHDMPDGLTF